MQGKEISIRASDPDKLDAIYEAFGLEASDFVNGAYTIPADQVGSLKIFGSAADDASQVKDIVTLF